MSFLPPPTDHGELQTFWNSFSVQHRRVQEGGWSPQVTVEDSPISKDIAGVNMSRTAGGVRELHWHNAAEWALVLSGSARITATDNEGKSYVQDMATNDLWFFPSGTCHDVVHAGDSAYAQRQSRQKEEFYGRKPVQNGVDRLISFQQSQQIRVFLGELIHSA